MFNPGLPARWILTLVLAAAPSAPAQETAQAVVTNDDRIPYAVSLGQDGAGTVEVRRRGPGTLLGTLEAGGRLSAASSDGNLELTFVPDARGTFRRDLKLADSDSNYCWFRAVKAGRGKPLVLQRASPVPEGVVYACDPAPATPVLSLRRRRPGEPAPATVEYRLALQNLTRTPLYFHLTDLQQLAGQVKLLPPNLDANNTTDGELPAGGARQLAVPARTRLRFSVLVADGDSWRNLDQVPHIERFTVSASPDRPMRLEADPFTRRDRNFTGIRLTVDDSDPEYPILKLESK
jgi:hypothetical protein